MKYYKEEFIKCPKCGTYIDQDSMMCRKCGYDYEKELKRGKSSRTKAL